MSDDLAARIVEAAARAFAATPEQPNRIQGFHYRPDFVVRDVWADPGQQEVWRGPDDDEPAFLIACDAARAKLRMRAALAAAVREAGLDAAELRLMADDVWHPDRVSFHPDDDPAPATAALLRALAGIADGQPGNESGPAQI